MSPLPTTVDPIMEIKTKAKATWAAGNFADIATLATTIPAAELVRFAHVRPGETLLDVGTGTGLVAVTAARKGAKVTGLDLTPELLEHARNNSEIAGVKVEWREGDAEALPYADNSFDVVLSQFGHMFAPRPEVAGRELVRVTKPGGRIAITTWPPDHYTGKMFALGARYVPPPQGAASPLVWGTPAKVKELLGNGVRDLRFETGVMRFPTLSPSHYRRTFEERFGPTVRLIQALTPTPDKLTTWRNEFQGLIEEYFEDNVVRQEFLMTRATKA